MEIEETRHLAHVLLVPSTKKQIKQWAKENKYRKENLPNWFGMLSTAYYHELREKHNKEESFYETYFGFLTR